MKVSVALAAVLSAVVVADAWKKEPNIKCVFPDVETMIENNPNGFLLNEPSEIIRKEIQNELAGMEAGTMDEFMGAVAQSRKKRSNAFDIIGVDVCPSNEYFIFGVRVGNNFCYIVKPQTVSFVSCAQSQCAYVKDLWNTRFHCLPKFVKKSVLIYCRHSTPRFRWHSLKLASSCCCRAVKCRPVKSRPVKKPLKKKAKHLSLDEGKVAGLDAPHNEETTTIAI